jgi:hypothetical protein
MSSRALESGRAGSEFRILQLTACDVLRADDRSVQSVALRGRGLGSNPFWWRGGIEPLYVGIKIRLII